MIRTDVNNDDTFISLQRTCESNDDIKCIQMSDIKYLLN